MLCNHLRLKVDKVQALPQVTSVLVQMFCSGAPILSPCLCQPVRAEQNVACGQLGKCAVSENIVLPRYGSKCSQ